MSICISQDTPLPQLKRETYLPPTGCVCHNTITALLLTQPKPVSQKVPSADTRKAGEVNTSTSLMCNSDGVLSRQHTMPSHITLPVHNGLEPRCPCTHLRCLLLCGCVPCWSTAYRLAAAAAAALTPVHRSSAAQHSKPQKYGRLLMPAMLCMISDPAAPALRPQLHSCSFLLWDCHVLEELAGIPALPVAIDSCIDAL